MAPLSRSACAWFPIANRVCKEDTLKSKNQLCPSETSWKRKQALDQRCCCCCCHCCCSCCCGAGGGQKHAAHILNEMEMPEKSEFVELRAASTKQHDYVIVDEVDADYLEIEPRKIETEFYYRILDRAAAEDLLTGGREDGACIVRPYKEADISIKYIISIYAQQQYFHLFIRRINGMDLYGIGQEKPYEKLFRSPSDIIDFYTCNALMCTNKSTSIGLVLKPIIA